jgi:hypothetical protein
MTEFISTTRNDGLSSARAHLTCLRGAGSVGVGRRRGGCFSRRALQRRERRTIAAAPAVLSQVLSQAGYTCSLGLRWTTQAMLLTTIEAAVRGSLQGQKEFKRLEHTSDHDVHIMDFIHQSWPMMCVLFELCCFPFCKVSLAPRGRRELLSFSSLGKCCNRFRLRQTRWVSQRFG